MTAQPVEPAPARMPLTIVFDSATSFADVPNLLGSHPGPGLIVGWLTQRLAPVAIKKRLRPGWHVTVTGTTGALRDRNGTERLTFEIIKGHRL